MATTISGGFVYGTEYTENFNRKDEPWKPMEAAPYVYTANIKPIAKNEPLPYMTTPSQPAGYLSRDPTLFSSQHYPNVYRETVLHKDDRGKYIDPFRNLSDRRRLLYDQSHPDKIYGSQWSSELQDVPSIYSFPTLTGLEPELPFAKDLQWQAEGEVGHWPTEMWKEWSRIARCPPYEGYTDQVEYSKYKVNPFTISSCPHDLP
ncbi:hypothetical protein LSAT2_011208 [Lamellibrachia satsuma]|nr:hypothetical protein LSAT2_011208 [Lamellibrachia satsuma]